MMRLYSSSERSVIDLSLPNNTPVKLYTCGPTVYDYPHIGNWYTFIRYDLLNRTLNGLGYTTNWVMNITDVGHLVSDADDGEDKLEKGAKREGKTAWDIATFYGDYFVNGLKRLNFSDISHLPKATEYIPQQIELVQRLEEKGFTYAIEDGIYFDTSKFPHYADFAHLNLSAQEEGARVEVKTEKRNPSDFAVWKFSPKHEKRDMEWESPCGIGFPGWHLECSAMIHAILGEPIDIHAGGTDHIPVHHTNEIAQTEAAYGTKLAEYWMHCNHILVDGKKMSKSLDNFYTLEDIEAKGYSLNVFRAHILSGHYRSQSEFSWENLEATKQRIQNWQAAFDMKWQIPDSPETGDDYKVDAINERIISALQDDLNSPEALSAIDSYVHLVNNRGLSSDLIPASNKILETISNFLGLTLHNEDITPEQKSLIATREASRLQKNWSEADSIRQKLSSEGIELRDTNFGVVWSRTV